MSNVNTNGTHTAPANGTPAAATKHGAALHATRDAALAAIPADAAKNTRPFAVQWNGKVLGWVNGRGHENALAEVARLDGYTVSTGDGTPNKTAAKAAAKLANLTDDQLAALGLARTAPATAS